MRNPRIEQIAAKLYSSELPYHNFTHAMSAVCQGEEIMLRCRAKGIVIDEEAVYYALLFHDAGYHEDHQVRGCATKEQYSAQLAAQVLREEGMPEPRIAVVEDLINSTHRDASFDTVEQKVVRAADLAGIAADYEVFLDNTERLRLEQELLTGRSIGWEEWKKSVAKTVNFYLGQQISITPKTQIEESGFHRRARRNLAKFLVET